MQQYWKYRETSNNEKEVGKYYDGELQVKYKLKGINKIQINMGCWGGWEISFVFIISSSNVSNKIQEIQKTSEVL